MIRTMKEDIRSVFQRDPAARSTLEVLLCYPGSTRCGCIEWPTGSGGGA
jgi:serine acetyltransferase